jgi:hypothetical protein
VFFRIPSSYSARILSASGSNLFSPQECSSQKTRNAGLHHTNCVRDVLKPAFVSVCFFFTIAPCLCLH